ncbi:MAG: class I SAM-dependent methyltransferase [Bacteroidota bacterium]
MTVNTHTIILLNRKIKSLLLRSRLHVFLEPITNPLLKLLYLSRLSQWCADQGTPPYNDLNSPERQLEKRYGLYDFVMNQQQLGGPIDYLEFGVAQGDSLKWWVEHNTHATSRFVGFDTFEGLPEKFEWLDSGTFSSGGKPPMMRDARCTFEVGMFQDTLEPFIKKMSFDRRTVIHLDADLYSSTLYVLARLGPHLKKGDVVLFDEFGVPMHEFRAFMDFAHAFRVKYELLGAVNNYMNVALRLT